MPANQLPPADLTHLTTAPGDPDPKWVGRFLRAFARLGNVTLAAKAAGVSRGYVYEYRTGHGGFAAAFDAAAAEAADVLEGEAHRRAFKGVDEPVIYQGEACGHWVDRRTKKRVPADQVADHPDARWVPLTVTRYSDALMVRLLQAWRPDKYRDNTRVVHAGDAAAPVRVHATVDGIPLTPEALRAMSDDDLRDRIADLEGRVGPADGGRGGGP